METTWFKATNSDWWDKEGGDYEPKIVATCDIPSNAVRKWEEWDVTTSIQEFIDNPSSNLGFHFFMSVTMVTVEYTSSESSDRQHRPKLTIETATGINTKKPVVNEQIKLSKTGDTYLLYLPIAGNSSVRVYDVMGKQVAAFNTSNSGEWYRMPNTIKPGVHVVKISNRNQNVVRKLWFLK